MRSMWKGAISFGLVSIPVKMYAATEPKNVRFTHLHEECKTPIRYKKVCPTCNREVENHEIVKGYEYEKGKYVVISDEELENIPLNSMRTIDIVDFVDLKEIDPIYFVKSYFLVPGDFGHKPYRLLFEALKKTKKIAVAKVVIRSRENLVALRQYSNCIVMETMLFSNEVRSSEGLPELQDSVEVHENELKMAEELIINLSTDFNPEKYASEYRKSLFDLIQSKIENRDIEMPVTPEKEKVVDLMEALKASLEATDEKEKPKRKSKKKASG